MKKSIVFCFLLLLLCGLKLFAQEARTIKVACVGNSITYGSGIKDRTNHSYPSVLERLLGSKYEVQNFGFSARTLLNKGDHPYMKEALFQKALDYQPDIVVIKLGTNDSKPINWKYKANFTLDMETMVTAFQNLPSHPKIYLCYPAKAYALQWGINDSIIVNEIMPRIDTIAAKLGATIIDLHTPTTGKEALFPDKIHPNPEGAVILASEVYKAISGQKVGKRVLYIGDSITDGNWGGGHENDSYNRNRWDLNHIFGSGYMYLCAAHYMGMYPDRGYEFFNRGISGNTLLDLEKRWNKDVIQMQPDILSILIGINDINAYLYNTKEPFDFLAWEKCYRKLLDDSRAQNPALKLVLCAPFTAKTGKMRSSKNFTLRDSLVRQCAVVVEKIAKDYNAIFVPYHILFDELSYVYRSTPDAYWIWDGIHPTAAGHQRMAELWQKKASALFE